jgi:(p)ppGpp synthase/HD superfamily hydrolase
MNLYAQTNLQLYQQLDREGYSQSDIQAIRKSYDIAIQKFSGYYRPSGKTFLAHLIGVASILAWLHQPINTVIAGLMHGIYQYGDFGNSTPTITPSKRNHIERLFDTHLESVLYHYAHFQPTFPSLQDYLDRFDHLSSIDREVLLIRLADVLEDSLHEGILYCPNWQGRKQHIQEIASITVELAHQLTQPTLADALEQTFNHVITIQPPQEIQRTFTVHDSFLVVPSYYRKTLPVLINEYIVHCKKILITIGQKCKRKLHRIFHSLSLSSFNH